MLTALNSKLNAIYGEKPVLTMLRAKVFVLVSMAMVALFGVVLYVDLWSGRSDSLGALPFSLAIIVVISLGLFLVLRGYYEKVVPWIFYAISLVLIYISVMTGLGGNPQTFFAITSMFFPGLIVGTALFIGVKIVLSIAGISIGWQIAYWLLFCANWGDKHLVDPSLLVYHIIALIMLTIIVVGLLKISQEAMERVSRELERNRKLALSLEKRVLERTYALEEAKLAAEEASVAKTQFLETITHEMRTPLNGIIGMNALLSHEDLTAEQMEFIQTSQNSARGLLTLINNIINMSRIDANQVELKKEPINLAKLLRSMHKFFNSDAQQKELSLELQFDEACDQLFMADEKRIRQILQSLISNGIKFTEQGRVTVIGKILRNNSATPLLHCTVKDTGIGVAIESVEHLFEKFKQLDQSRTRRFEGTGLGLAIAKSLVELMGGEIGVNDVNVGAEFWFTVPLAKVPQINQQATTERM